MWFPNRSDTNRAVQAQKVRARDLQGYPINYVEQARAQQHYNLPWVSLQFRSEQMSQNPFQGYPVGSVRQVHTSSEQVQSRQSSHRANLQDEMVFTVGIVYVITCKPIV